MVICGICTESISSRKPTVTCSICKLQVHPSCLHASADLVALFNSVKGLYWKCDTCTESCITINDKEVGRLLDEKVERALSAVNSKLTTLQSEIVKTIRVSAPDVPPVDVPSYSTVLKNRSLPAMIIQPKNSSQNPSQTRSDIARGLSLEHNEIQLSRIKNLRNGGVLVGCKTKEDHERLSGAVQEKMGQSYSVKEVSGVFPRIRMVGLSEEYPPETLPGLLKRCNTEIFSANTECKVVKIFPTRRDVSVFQCVLQLDRTTYDRVMKFGNLFVGFDSCVVYDAIEIFRCYNCNEFYHSSKSCKKAVVCPLCGLNHDVKSCRSNDRKCSNCCALNSRLSLTVPTDHAVWEKDKCSAYKRAGDKLRADILSVK